MNTKTDRATTFKIERNLEALLTYLLCWVSGIFFIIFEKKNDYVRFHAFQSTAVFLSLLILRFILGVIPVIGAVGSTVILLITFLLWVFLMYKAFNGEEFRLPLVGDFAARMTDRNKKE